MLSTGEAARMLGLHVNTVRRWDNWGILYSRRVGPRGDRRFRKDEIEERMRMMQSRLSPGNEERN
ncbi:MAG: DNA-binding protein [Dehalococcoidia bacterium]|nr:MAG: DNA-binding protein [Dehalococcoidia bacterium]